jgi:hypothetical protein
VQGHDHLFHGGVARAFADAVDGNFGLPGAGTDGGEVLAVANPRSLWQ